MSQTFPLISPVDDVTELTLEEPTVAEIAKLKDDTIKFGEVRALVALIAAQTKQPATIINRLRARDFRAMERHLGSFFEDAPATSETSLPK
jgi:hypothetical protein